MERYRALVEKGTSNKELRQIKEILEENGFEWEVEAVVVRKSYLEKLPWIIMLYLPLRKFFDSFMSEFGKDIYRLLRNKVRKLHNLRRAQTRSQGSIMTRDKESGLICQLPIEMSDESLMLALRKLRETDLKKFDHGPLYYDKETDLWLPFDK